jgi:hypothetical protein
MNVSSQYAPQAGIAGSTAISAISPLIVNWANSCSIQRGWLNIKQKNLGVTSSGDSSLAVGIFDHAVVSLGDSGVATLGFPSQIMNGAGADFVVFENGFINPANPEEAFLELALVEVSSDSVHFIRFPARSLTQTDTQIAGSGMYMNARLLNNLAGKYASGFGVPFDLDELAGSPNLDVNHIVLVRLVDVVGAIDESGCKDDSAHLINDPYPTDFPTGGFDLDAVGVLHQQPLSIDDATKELVTVYPNPASDFLMIESKEPLGFQLNDLAGRVLISDKELSQKRIEVSSLEKGIYTILFTNKEGKRWARLFTKL